MQLFEFEGKQLFQTFGINIPPSQLIGGLVNQNINIKPPLVLKAQVLSGKRAEAGGIIKVQSSKFNPSTTLRIDGEQSRTIKVQSEIQKIIGQIINGEKVERVLVEEMVDYDKEYYLSFSYSTETRGPVLTFGEGGSGVENKKTETFPISLSHLGGVIAEVLPKVLVSTAEKLWQVFTKYDLELAEINPLVVSSSRHSREGGNPINSNIYGSPVKPGMTDEGNGKVVYALDAKVILDDDADFRREVKFPERNTFGRNPTHAEIEARKIDKGDHRGTAGSVYWDLGGDIAVIAAGGGGSIVNMDALLAFGGKPANYTEHSGNPPREKIKKLTKIVLAKPNLKGCWFVGGTANFTDIYETLMGFVEGLREIKPKPAYPIVIRRGGPRDKEAFEALKEIGKKEGFNFHIYGRETPMTSTAKMVVELAYGSKYQVSKLQVFQTNIKF